MIEIKGISQENWIPFNNKKYKINKYQIYFNLELKKNIILNINFNKTIVKNYKLKI